MGGSMERNGRTYIYGEFFSVRDIGETLRTYVFDVFQIFHVSHLSLDKLKNYTIQNK